MDASKTIEILNPNIDREVTDGHHKLLQDHYDDAGVVLPRVVEASAHGINMNETAREMLHLHSKVEAYKHTLPTESDSSTSHAKEAVNAATSTNTEEINIDNSNNDSHENNSKLIKRVAISGSRNRATYVRPSFLDTSIDPASKVDGSNVLMTVGNTDLSEGESTTQTIEQAAEVKPDQQEATAANESSSSNINVNLVGRAKEFGADTSPKQAMLGMAEKGFYNLVTIDTGRFEALAPAMEAALKQAESGESTPSESEAVEASAPDIKTAGDQLAEQVLGSTNDQGEVKVISETNPIQTIENPADGTGETPNQLAHQQTVAETSVDSDGASEGQDPAGSTEVGSDDASQAALRAAQDEIAQVIEQVKETNTSEVNVHTDSGQADTKVNSSESIEDSVPATNVDTSITLPATSHNEMADSKEVPGESVPTPQPKRRSLFGMIGGLFMPGDKVNE